MTLQQIYAALIDYKPAILLAMLFAPWLALGICIATPGKKEEPFVLSLNLFLAAASLLMVVGYVWYATHTAGVSKLIEEADILLVLAPCYYVGVSLWVTRQRLPLSQVPAARVIQGIGLICAGYLGLAWLLSKLRIVLFSFLPVQVLLFVVLGLLAVGYMGYQRVTGADVRSAARGRSGSSSRASSSRTGIDEELDNLRRDLDNDNV